MLLLFWCLQVGFGGVHTSLARLTLLATFIARSPPEQDARRGPRARNHRQHLLDGRWESTHALCFPYSLSCTYVELIVHCVLQEAVIASLEMKLTVLREEKETLVDEIRENEALGSDVSVTSLPLPLCELYVNSMIQDRNSFILNTMIL